MLFDIIKWPFPEFKCETVYGIRFTFTVKQIIVVISDIFFY